MNYTNIILIAIALSLDAVAVAAANGAKHHKMSLLQAVRIAAFFGFFQFFMPIIGWIMGTGITRYISNFDHWVAFSLLALLGIKMIFESFKESDDRALDIHGLKMLLLLSIATSIDALVVGLTFALLSVNLIISSVLIGVITFLLSLSGIYAGKKFGKKFGRRSEIIGGLVLVSIGVKILTSHLLT